MFEERYCVTCGRVAIPDVKSKGNTFFGCLMTLFCLVVPGLIYLLWCWTNRKQVCSSCGSEEVIPLDSPRAREALAKR
jgi:hypothetical protein